MLPRNPPPQARYTQISFLFVFSVTVNTTTQFTMILNGELS